METLRNRTSLQGQESKDVQRTGDDCSFRGGGQLETPECPPVGRSTVQGQLVQTERTEGGHHVLLLVKED